MYLMYYLNYKFLFTLLLLLLLHPTSLDQVSLVKEIHFKGLSGKIKVKLILFNNGGDDRLLDCVLS